MAELGLAASVVSLIELSGQVIILSCEYIGKVKRSGKEIKELVEELKSLQEVLKIFQSRIQENPDRFSRAVQTVCGENGPLQECLRDLEALQEKMKLKTGIKGMVDRLKWPIRDGKISLVKARLERSKSLFLLAFAVDQMPAVAGRREIPVEITCDHASEASTQSEDSKTQEDAIYTGQNSFP